MKYLTRTNIFILIHCFLEVSSVPASLLGNVLEDLQENVSELPSVPAADGPVNVPEMPEDITWGSPKGVVNPSLPNPFIDPEGAVEGSVNNPKDSSRERALFASFKAGHDAGASGADTKMALKTFRDGFALGKHLYLYSQHSWSETAGNNPQETQGSDDLLTGSADPTGSPANFAETAGNNPQETQGSDDPFHGPPLPGSADPSWLAANFARTAGNKPPKGSSDDSFSGSADPSFDPLWPADKI